MTASFWAAYAEKMIVAALVLCAVYVLARRLRQGRLFAPGRRLRVVDSAMLSQHAAVWLLRAGGRYFLVGGGSGGISTLAELAPADVEAPLQELPRATA
ncbi:MAG: flagellar biosynthetic protein FliO [Candidatus Baltobacteraceae bacterium]